MPTSKTVNLKLWRQNFERVAAVQGEDKARVLSMVISEREGVPFDMSGYTAEIYMHEANGRDVTLPAEIDGNIVTAVIPLITAAGDAAIQVILTKSTGEILKVAGIVLDVQPSELENAVDGSDEFNLLVGVTKQAEKAAGDALEAADIALEAADSVKARADSGEFNGEKGDTGPDGPQGVSGVYVGGGEMPEGYTVQVDPTGDMMCYTAGESDSRYLRATEIRRPFTGGGITLTDADDAAFGGVTVLGATTETGTGGKGPDNPYALTGVQPTAVTVCGRNLADVARVWVRGNPEFSVEKFPGGFYLQADTWVTRILAIPCSLKAGKTYVVSYRAENVGSVSVKTFMYLPRINQYLNGSGKPFVPNADTDTLGIYVGLEDVAEGVKIKISDVQVELSPAATPYEPYSGQTVPVPTLEPLYGDGTVNDEYDAATGVETRRWKRLVFNGTENWGTTINPSGNKRYYTRVPDSVFYSRLVQIACSHWASISPGLTYQDETGITLTPDTANKSIWLYDPRFAGTDLPTFKAWLAAQYAAGTPVTVVYQLDAPVVTQHGPQRIHTYPGCTNLMLDISAEGAVRYPLSAPMQWDAKADKTAADDRYANVLTGTASGPVAALEDVSPTGALRRAAVLGATAETGSGDKGPDNPYTLAGVQPTKVTVCGRNLAANPRFNAADQFSPCVYADCELQPNTKYTISLYVPAGEAYYTNENLFAKIVYLPVSTGGIYSAEATTKPTISNTDPKQYATGKGWTLLKAQSGTTASGNARDLQIEFGDTATPYEPYTGQTITLPALEPLYGDGTVNDEYDAVSGVETRRWGILTPDGTGATYNANNGDAYFSLPVSPHSVAGSTFGQSDKGIATHFPFTLTAKNTARAYISNFGARLLVFFGPEHADIDTVEKLKTWLSTQATAGAPVTVVYQLAEPVITQHDPARILPPAPVCRVFADAGGVDVGYNRDINIAFEQQQAEYIAQIKALDARIAKLETGQPAEPMT